MAPLPRLIRALAVCLTALPAVALLLSAPAGARAQMPADGIAAIVNDEVIPFSEVRKRVEDTERVLRDTYNGQELIDRIKEARLNTLRALIERELIIQDFKKQGYFIPESITEDRLRETIQNQYEGDRTAFIRTIQANGLSLDQYKKELRERTIVDAMRMKNVSNNVIISPFKIEQYYQDNIRQFSEDPQAQVSIILIKKALFPETAKGPDGKEVSYDPSEKVAQELLFKLDTGADFAEIARSYSDGPKRSDGGSLGWVKKDDLRPELAKVAFTLQPGQTSRVIATDEGYYILHVDDVKRSRVVPIAEVRAKIEQTLIQDDRQRLQQQWLDGLRAKAFIKTEF